MILLGCIVVAVVTLGAGGLLTEIGPWYFRLDVPPWKPPNWAFGPIWTTIGILSVVGADRALHHTGGGERTVVITLFGLNALFNVLWSLFFFKLKRPDWALVDVVPLWLSVLALVVVLWPVRGAGWFLLPYLVWVSIAAALNRSIVRRNAPFGAAHRTEAHPGIAE
jgi:tryptophan-rich sensory protein